MACENNTCMRLCFPPSPPLPFTSLSFLLLSLPYTLPSHSSLPFFPFSPPFSLPILSPLSLYPLLSLSLLSPCSHLSHSLLSLFSPFPLPPLSHFSPSLFFLSYPLSLPLLHSFLLISPCSIFPHLPSVGPSHCRWSIVAHSR